MTQRLPAAVWRPLATAHETRVDQFTAGHRDRRRRGQPHPIEDFLWRYYSFRPIQLRQWLPGAFVELEDAPERESLKFHEQVDGAVRLDVPAYLAKRGHAVKFVHDLVQATLSRPAQFGCFGMHEWAMVFEDTHVRHEQLPLRLGHEATDEVVRSAQMRCSHYDAFRFFTAAARPRNAAELTREGQIADEQPGCLHAGMDLYKHCYKLWPAISSELTMDCFEFALDSRLLDMQASPYDLRSFGQEPVAIETPSGRAEYTRRQRELSARGQRLRKRLLDQTAVLLSAQRLPA